MGQKKELSRIHIFMSQTQEIWFGILSRKALKNASFSSVVQLRTAIEDFIEVYQQNVKPFIWRKREVKGSQLRNTLTNLYN